MKQILVLGAGGAPAVNFTRSLRETTEPLWLIGTDSDKFNLQRAETDERYLVPRANDPDYIPVLREIISRRSAEFIHAQNDIEMRYISEHRDELCIRYFLPSQETVAVCLDKFESHQRWKQAGVPQPITIFINDAADLERAFDLIPGKIWLRFVCGSGGKGSIALRNVKLAREWIELHGGWGRFTAAQYLGEKTATWLSIWKNGQLVVAQGRARAYWELGKLAVSGVSGATGTGITINDTTVDEMAQKAIFAIDNLPNGIFGVDMTYAGDGTPVPTEINIGRFFTTHHFFTRAGLNMPYIFVKIGFNETPPAISRRLNPLPSGLAWIRGIDKEPVLTTMEEVEQSVKDLESLEAELRVQKTVG